MKKLDEAGFRCPMSAWQTRSLMRAMISCLSSSMAPEKWNTSYLGAYLQLPKLLVSLGISASGS